MPNLSTPPDSFEQSPPMFERLADARRCLRVAYNLERHPVMLAPDRAEIQRIKAAATVCLGAAIEELIDVLDLVSGDPDLESNDAEDEALSPWALRYARSGPGCDVADAGEDEGDREGIDEREPEEGV